MIISYIYRDLIFGQWRLTTSNSVVCLDKIYYLYKDL